MDDPSEDDVSVGSFNGVDIAPEDFSVHVSELAITYTFHALVGPDDADSTCIVAAASDARGNLHPAAEHNCPPAPGDTGPDTAPGSDTDPDTHTEDPTCGCAAGPVPGWLALTLVGALVARRRQPARSHSATSVA